MQNKVMLAFYHVLHGGDWSFEMCTKGGGHEDRRLRAIWLYMGANRYCTRAAKQVCGLSKCNRGKWREGSCVSSRAHHGTPCFWKTCIPYSTWWFWSHSGLFIPPAPIPCRFPSCLQLCMVGNEKLLMPAFPIQFLQLYCEKARIKDAAFDQLKTSLDVGDFVGAKGTIKRTEKGRWWWSKYPVCSTIVLLSLFMSLVSC